MENLVENNNVENRELEPYKKQEFLRYRAWYSLPSMFKNPPRNKNGHKPSVEEFLQVMNIDDPDILELALIPDQKTFGERYGVGKNVMTAWNKKINSESSLNDIRAWGRKLSKNVMLALYNTSIRKGFGQDVKTWLQVVEAWEEKQRVEIDYKGVEKVIIIQESDDNQVETDEETGPSMELPTGSDNA